MSQTSLSSVLTFVCFTTWMWTCLYSWCLAIFSRIYVGISPAMGYNLLFPASYPTTSLHATLPHYASLYASGLVQGTSLSPLLLAAAHYSRFSSSISLQEDLLENTPQVMVHSPPPRTCTPSVTFGVLSYHRWLMTVSPPELWAPRAANLYPHNYVI